jgi:hypothetical protein
VAAVLGGIGNVAGAFLGSMVLGLLESVGPNLFLDGLGIPTPSQLKDAIAFINLPSLQALEADLKRFALETGWQIGHGEHPAVDILAHRTGIAEGLDPAGSACIAFLDPKRFRERYTVYVVPVADWTALVKATAGEELAPGQYALTGAAGPRFVARRGKFALVTSSIRTLDALADSKPLLPDLAAETVARAAAGPMVYVRVHELKTIHEYEIASWFRAASGQVYNQPEVLPYADMMVTYMLGIADLLDQVETPAAAVGFGPDGLAVDVSARFVEGSGSANFLGAQAPGATPLPAVTDRPLTSETCLRLDPKARTDLLMRMTRFFLESAPRPQPLPDATRKSVERAMQVFAGSLGEHMTFLSAPAEPGMGLVTEVTILDLKDPAEFRHGVDLLVSSWETLADQLNLYLRFTEAPETAIFDGVEVVSYVPRLRFGVPARHVEFRERLKKLYGPEGIVYRVAVVGSQAVIGTGSDLTLFRQTLRRLRGGREPEPSPAVRRLEQHVPANQNVYIAMSLPLVIAQSLERGGTPVDRVGTVDPGHEVAGLGVQGEKTSLRIMSYWPHEQIRLARELLNRAAPDMAEIPKSLFEPTPEGPPKPEGEKAPKGEKPKETAPAEKPKEPSAAP